MANKDLAEMWLEGIESAMQKLHAHDTIRDVDLRRVNGMMVHTGIHIGVDLQTAGTVQTYGNEPITSYESGACGSYASGACVSYASGACLPNAAV